VSASSSGTGVSPVSFISNLDWKKIHGRDARATIAAIATGNLVVTKLPFAREHFGRIKMARTRRRLHGRGGIDQKNFHADYALLRF
jgi:hypothetical protein